MPAKYGNIQEEELKTKWLMIISPTTIVPQLSEK